MRNQDFDLKVGQNCVTFSMAPLGGPPLVTLFYWVTFPSEDLFYGKHFRTVAYFGGRIKGDPPNGMTVAKDDKRKRSLCLYGDQNGQKK